MSRMAKATSAGSRAAIADSGVLLQRKCACGGALAFDTTCRACQGEGLQVSRRATASTVSQIAPGNRPPTVGAGGVGLDAPTRAFMETRFGHDFGSVRVHTDARSAESARAVDALAYTVGRDVVFAPGQYQPHTRAGLGLLAHELAHTVQQSGGGAPTRASAKISSPHSEAEREADHAAQRALDGETVRVRRQAEATVQRAWNWGRAGIGALIGGGVGALLGAIGGPIGALIGLGAGALVGGVIGGLTGRERTEAQRACDPQADAIRRHSVYRTLQRRVRRLADTILREALARLNCSYFLEKLKLLFDTPEAPPGGSAPEPGSVTERNRARVERAVAQERERLATPQAQSEINRQEQIADDPSRVWTPRRGRNGKTFLVDRTDPTHIVVRVKIRLVARGASTAEDATNMVFLEDAAERLAETSGYTLDIVFTDTDGPDVFTVGTDVSKWPTSGNIVGNARTLAHEIHHLLGLDDRYNYIEAHAANRHMRIPDRLYWFLQQMRRTPDPDASRSLMGSGNTLLDDDVCRVAGLDPATCVPARERGAP